jgi:hypothetical protein
MQSAGFHKAGGGRVGSFSIDVSARRNMAVQAPHSLPQDEMDRSAGAMPAAPGPKGFILPRLRGQIPLRIVFVRDMLLIGTAVNVVAGMAGLMLIAAEASTNVALGGYFAPLPLNIFLLFAVWRRAAEVGKVGALMARLVSALWFALALIV